MQKFFYVVLRGDFHFLMGKYIIITEKMKENL